MRRTIVTAAVAIALALTGPAASAAAPTIDAVHAPMDPTAHVVAAAKQALAMQVQFLGGYTSKAPAPATHATPSDAVNALLARHAVTPDAHAAVDIAALNALPAPTRAALTDLVNAFLAMEDASALAFAHADHADIARIVDGRAPARALHELGIDLAPAVAARLAFLDASAALGNAVRDFGVGTKPVEIHLPPALGLDLIGESTTYPHDMALVIDAGGDDTYTNNAGGGILIPGALLDLAGRDRYVSGRNDGVNGGGTFASGTLVDLGTDGDVYFAGDNGTNGGGKIGTGFLLDQGGSDTYTAGDSGTNGGGWTGTGLLVDGEGNDAFTGGQKHVNGAGGFFGSGYLIDLAGNDLYVGNGWGVNGWGGILGTGALIDTGGQDNYSTDGGASYTTDLTIVPYGYAGMQLDVEVGTPALPTTTLPATPSGPPALGPDADGDGVPAVLLVPHCTPTLDANGYSCPPAPPMLVAMDPDDADAGNPATLPGVEARLHPGCARDDVCGEVVVVGPTGELRRHEFGDEARIMRAAFEDIERYTGVRPVHLDADGLTVTRPPAARVAEDEVAHDAGLVSVHVGGIALSYSEDAPVHVDAPAASVRGVTQADADAGDVREPAPFPAVRHAITTLLPEKVTHPLPTVEV